VQGDAALRVGPQPEAIEPKTDPSIDRQTPAKTRSRSTIRWATRSPTPATALPQPLDAIKVRPDAALTLYLQNANPGKDKEAN